MFLGHYGVALVAKRIAPSASLGALFFAAQFLDLLWPTMLLFGVERVAIVPGITAVTPLDFVHYPISHSLGTAICWGLVVGSVAYEFQRSRRMASVLMALVVSHWFLDLLVHRPDLPLTPFTDVKLGLGLWNSIAGTWIAELSVFAIGVWVYARATRARDTVGRWGFAGLVTFLLLVFAANLLGGPPPSVEAIAWLGQALWLLVLWGFWVDRHREPRVGVTASGS